MENEITNGSRKLPLMPTQNKTTGERMSREYRNAVYHHFEHCEDPACMGSGQCKDYWDCECSESEEVEE